jgi:hypothetical protein
MKTIILFLTIISLSIMTAEFLYVVDRKSKIEHSTTPSEIIQKTLDLYKSKIKLPDNVLIAIPGRDTSEVYLFCYGDAVEGLKYVGRFGKEGEK